jgi:hypothetical protein
MQNRTIGIVATIITALACGCASLFSCIWGFLISSGTPINVTSNGTTTPQTFSPVIHWVYIVVPVRCYDTDPGRGRFLYFAQEA